MVFLKKPMWHALCFVFIGLVMLQVYEYVTLLPTVSFDWDMLVLVMKIAIELLAMGYVCFRWFVFAMLNEESLVEVWNNASVRRKTFMLCSVFAYPLPLLTCMLCVVFLVAERYLKKSLRYYNIENLPEDHINSEEIKAFYSIAVTEYWSVIFLGVFFAAFALVSWDYSQCPPGYCELGAHLQDFAADGIAIVKIPLNFVLLILYGPIYIAGLIVSYVLVILFLISTLYILMGGRVFNSSHKMRYRLLKAAYNENVEYGEVSPESSRSTYVFTDVTDPFVLYEDARLKLSNIHEYDFTIEDGRIVNLVPKSYWKRIWASFKVLITI